jgi:anti-sigma regulatory factor (Ser/Thr protein kinase)
MGNAFTVRDERDVSQARQYVFDRCRASGLPMLCDDAALLASEVVTNALRHAGGAISVRAERDGETLVVQVLDPSPSEPVVLLPDPWSETGRGMSLVDAIAREWGVVPHPAGKVVWFRL